MNVKGNYLKNESGETFSPIVSTDTIFYNGQTLTSILQNIQESYLYYKVLYKGTLTVNSRTNGSKITINLSQSGILDSIDTLIIGNLHRVSLISRRVDETRVCENARSIGFMDVSTYGGEYTNMFGFWLQCIDSSTIQVWGSQLTTITTAGDVNINSDYTTNISFIYGINLNMEKG